jgi:lipoyl(octanoyl) transferase
MHEIIIRQLNLQPYELVWKKMSDFTQNRLKDTPDEFWLVEHFPVFTQGQAGKSEHILNPGLIPVIQTDRGGQVTYHGPGQVVLYTLVDLKRRNLNIKSFSSALEQAIIALLNDYGIKGVTRQNAPGVYVNNAKIASLGLRVRKGCSYHGLSLNVAMDLEPFTRINPCGFAELKVVQMSEFDKTIQVKKVSKELAQHLAILLKYTSQ